MGGSCTWSEKLARAYPGFTAAKNGKTDYCHCNLCDKDISIRHKGKTDIENHMKTTDHNRNSKKVAGTQPLTVHFNEPTQSALDNAAKEAAWCYHKVQNTQSFSSIDCDSDLIRQLFGQKEFRVGRTKCSAIVANVFAPRIVDEMQSALKTCNFVSIGTDASNHVAIKMFPIVGRWFNPLEGIQSKILDLSEETGL